MVALRPDGRQGSLSMMLPCDKSRMSGADQIGLFRLAHSDGDKEQWMRRTDGQVEHHDHHRTRRSGAIDATIYYRDPRIVRAHQRQLLRNESRPCRVRSRSSARRTPRAKRPSVGSSSGRGGGAARNRRDRARSAQGVVLTRNRYRSVRPMLPPLRCSINRRSFNDTCRLVG